MFRIQFKNRFAFTATAVLLALLSFLLLLILAGRSIRDTAGYFRATARVSTDRLTQQLPTEVHDAKLQADLDNVRQQLLDQQVRMNVAANETGKLQVEVRELEKSVNLRKTLLDEAYTILVQAEKKQLPNVKFTNREMKLADFERDIDELLATQKRETDQLKIKRAGLARQEKTINDGERLLAELRSTVERTEGEIVLLKSRREQAALERKTLDLVHSVTSSDSSAAASVGKAVDQMKQDVETAEARNRARRDLAPAVGNTHTNQVARLAARMQSLKANHDEMQRQPDAENP